MKIKLLITTIAILFISCENSNTWSQEDQKYWRDMCNDLYGSYEYCECTLNYLMDKYSSAFELEQEPDGGFQAGYDAGMYCINDGMNDDFGLDIMNAMEAADDLMYSDPVFSYDSFMEGCLIDESFRNYCNCAYNKIELYGFEYYISNLESIAADCAYHLY